MKSVKEILKVTIKLNAHIDLISHVSLSDIVQQCCLI